MKKGDVGFQINILFKKKNVFTITFETNPIIIGKYRANYILRKSVLLRYLMDINASIYNEKSTQQKKMFPHEMIT